MSIGDALRKRREELGLTYDEIYKVSRIRHVFVKAMEEERWEEFPSASQARAFLKKYAKVLGFSDDFIDIYGESLPAGYPQFRSIREKNRHESKGPLSWLLYVALFLVLVLMGYLLWDLGYAKFSKGFRTVRNGDKAATGSTPTKTERPSEVQGSVVKERQEGTEPAKPSPYTPVEQTKVTTDLHKVSLICNERSWVRVYLDQEPVKDYLFNPGDRYEWVAKEGLEIKIGNAAGIELEYNGKRYHSLGKKGQVVLLRFPETFQRKVGY